MLHQNPKFYFIHDHPEYIPGGQKALRKIKVFREKKPLGQKHKDSAIGHLSSTLHLIFFCCLQVPTWCMEFVVPAAWGRGVTTSQIRKHATAAIQLPLLQPSFLCRCCTSATASATVVALLFPLLLLPLLSLSGLAAAAATAATPVAVANNYCRRRCRCLTLFLLLPMLPISHCSFPHVLPLAVANTAPMLLHCRCTDDQ